MVCCHEIAVLIGCMPLLTSMKKERNEFLLMTKQNNLHRWEIQDVHNFSGVISTNMWIICANSACIWCQKCSNRILENGSTMPQGSQKGSLMWALYFTKQKCCYYYWHLLEFLGSSPWSLTLKGRAPVRQVISLPTKSPPPPFLITFLLPPAVTGNSSASEMRCKQPVSGLTYTKFLTHVRSQVSN